MDTPRVDTTFPVGSHVRDPKLHGRRWGLCPCTKHSRDMSVHRLTPPTRNAGVPLVTIAVART